MSAPQKIIIDTDPGQDDAVAILLALSAPEQLDVLGICAVHGNVTLEKTAANALALVNLAGRPDVPVLRGCARPILAPAITAEAVHGYSGIDDWTPPAHDLDFDARHAVDFIIETLENEPARSVRLVTLGPLTNIALAMIKAPQIIPRIQEIVIMGGAFFFGGNSTATSEWNILVDPHAAAVVFQSGAPITLFPLDVTHKAPMPPAFIAEMGKVPPPLGTALFQMLDFYNRYDKEKYGIIGSPLHDPVTVAYLLQPALFSGKQVHVAIEHQSPLTMGMTVFDWWNVQDQPPNAHVMQEIDAKGYFALIVQQMHKLAEKGMPS